MLFGELLCFNPRPALLPGDAFDPPADCSQIRKFHRARHCCRAMPNPRGFGPTTHCFQSAPALLAGDPLMTSVRSAPPLFSIRARHCCRAILHRAASRGLPWRIWDTALALMAGDPFVRKTPR